VLLRFTRQVPFWPINRFVGQQIRFGQYSKMPTKGAIFNCSIPITIFSIRAKIIYNSMVLLKIQKSFTPTTIHYIKKSKKNNEISSIPNTFHHIKKSKNVKITKQASLPTLSLYIKKQGNQETSFTSTTSHFFL
jgi:hypothetical protein